MTTLKLPARHKCTPGTTHTRRIQSTHCSEFMNAPTNTATHLFGRNHLLPLLFICFHLRLEFSRQGCDFIIQRLALGTRCFLHLFPLHVPPSFVFRQLGFMLFLQAFHLLITLGFSLLLQLFLHTSQHFRRRQLSQDRIMRIPAFGLEKITSPSTHFRHRFAHVHNAFRGTTPRPPPPPVPTPKNPTNSQHIVVHTEVSRRQVPNYNSELR